LSKNVAVFVDVANIFYAAKAAGVDIDYVTLLKSATAGRDFVRAYAYTGLDPDNENQRNFHNFLARNGYKVVSKDIRKYGDGRVKANLDIELVVDLMKTARNLDVAVVVSGDGDFAPAIRAVQEMGVRVEVVSFRGNTSSDLIDVADLFTDITQVARVEKGSTRSGRRVAGDQEDLSMTEVPDKQTEGAARGRTGRGRTSRGRDAKPTDEAELESAPAASGRATSSAGRRGGGVVALPGERIAKAGPTEELPAAEIEDGTTTADAIADGEAGDEGRRRRRRRRGGRGRGRGRGVDATGQPGDVPDELDELPEVAAIAPTTAAPRPGAFGSVWDSQIGIPSGAGRPEAPLDEGDFDEPEIPEYLIAEQRRGGRGGGRGSAGGRGGSAGRGGRSAYVAALERERYGGGRGSTFNRYPDTSGRGPGRMDQGPRPDRRDRPERAPRRSSNEPWSEVPPELEEMLRAQLDARAARGASAADRASESREATAAAEPVAAEPASSATPPSVGRRKTPARPRAAKAAAVPAEVAAELVAAEPVAAEPKPAPKATRKRTTASAATAGAAKTSRAAVSTAKSGSTGSTTRGRTSRTASPSRDGDSESGSMGGPPDDTAKPRRRTTRKAATAD
jgi:uncharacterized LabA/DUF88 family protein